MTTIEKKTYPMKFIGVETTFPNGKERTSAVFRFDREMVRYLVFSRDLKDELGMIENYSEVIIHLEEIMNNGFHGFFLVGVETVETV